MQNVAFPALVQLATINPAAYRREIRRLHEQEPERLEGFVEWFCLELEKETGRPRRRDDMLAIFLGATKVPKRGAGRARARAVA